MRAGLVCLIIGGIVPWLAASAGAQAPKGSLERDYLGPLRSASCPPGSEAEDAQAIDIGVRHVSLQGMNPSRKTVGELTFVDGFHLTSTDKRFGSLSGLDLLEDGNLLAVSDDGDLVWIDLAEDGLTPEAARIAPMRDVSGKVLRGKAEGDAEGLAYKQGLALVSFERNHRVLAFDVGACGSAARGAPAAFGGLGGSLEQAFDRAELDVSANEGPEALAVTPDWFVFTGLEAQTGGASPLSGRAIEAQPEFDMYVGRDVPSVVGMDIVTDGDEVRMFSLHRSTNAMASTVIAIAETVFTREVDQAGLPARVTSEIAERSHVRFRQTSSRVLARMNIFLTIDNYEGIAAREMPDGRVRLYVIADDNFSARQRTLLMVYDVAKRG